VLKLRRRLIYLSLIEMDYRVASFNKLKILVVDDTEPMRLLVKGALEALGVVQIFLADNGLSAQGIIKKEDPDIIFLDWNMEPMDGLTLMRDIRTNTMYPDRMVPIIMMTGYSTKNRVQEARDAGIHEFLVKPFSADDLMRRLVSVINNPRNFIEASDFKGPDRRRKVRNAFFQGPYRRDTDEKTMSTGDSWDIV
jgi:two-component system chemotaxis response regulator CheY